MGENAVRDLVGKVEQEEQLRRQAEAEVRANLAAVERQNELIKQINERIAKVIEKVSGQAYTDVAEDLWKWWDAYNETEYQKYKPDRYTRSVAVYTVAEYNYTPPPSPAPVRREVPPGTRRSCECFVAGTSVVTQWGMKPIEAILPGDLVLNRDLHTGRLDWKPVLKPTMREPSPIVEIAAGDDTFLCTSGHLFWVSGAGWKKASELKAGDVLHGAKTPTTVVSTINRPAAPTFNLEVADSPNYFVGKSMLLTHDVTPRETNRQKVPGQDLLRRVVEKPTTKAAGKSTVSSTR
ncbi:MAG: polymorphic toxin-type HINT domain-containing protein [Pirellulales bacterium]